MSKRQMRTRVWVEQRPRLKAKACGGIAPRKAAENELIPGEAVGLAGWPVRGPW